MNDPASGVQQQLLPHMHLVSKSRYPVTNSLTMETAVDYLLSAPNVVRELQQMHWMFIDGPPDGTVMLAWQPLHQLGTNFASDGYIWADAEQAFTTEARGYTVEMWLHRSGYHPPNENVATHCRRRYRLTPSKNPNPNLPPCDPALWIIHYSRAPATDHIPANRIPIVPQIQNILSQRRFLQSQGQLPRKEFMLHDRNNWPTISLPSQQGQQGIPPQAAYQTALHARQQQGAFYPQQGHVLPGSAGPAPNKAPRAARGSSTAAAGVVDMSLEDEEISTGDFLDMLTPREISKMRYKQHHEWMEEVFSSPYTNNQTVPVDLGLGRKGELESLTAGYFNAPAASSIGSKDANERSNAEKIAPEKAKEFTDRVTRKVAGMNAEIEKMKRRHARRMEKVGRAKLLKEAELKLRDAAANPSDIGSEAWRLEGRQDPEGDGSVSPIDREEQKPKYKVDHVVHELETAWGAKIVPNPTVTCVQKGGLQERVELQVPDEPMNSDKDLADMDAVMENADSHVRDQFGSTVNSPFGGGQSTPYNESLAVADTSGTFNIDGGPDIPASEPTKLNFDQDTAPPMQGMDIDVEMSGVLNEPIAESGNKSDDTGDWVMVGNEGEKPSPKDENAPSGDNIQQASAAPDTTSAAPTAPAPATTTEIPPQVPASEPTPAAPAAVENVTESTAAPTTSPAPAPAPASQPAAPEGSAAEATPQAPTPPEPQPAQQQQQQEQQPTTEPKTPAPEQPPIHPAGDNALAESSDQQQNNNEPGEQPSGSGDVGGGLDLPEMENSAFGDAFHMSDTERAQSQGREQEGQQEQARDQGEGQGQGQGQEIGTGGNGGGGGVGATGSAGEENTSFKD